MSVFRPMLYMKVCHGIVVSSSTFIVIFADSFIAILLVLRLCDYATSSYEVKLGYIIRCDGENWNNIQFIDRIKGDKHYLITRRAPRTTSLSLTLTERPITYRETCTDCRDDDQAGDGPAGGREDTGRPMGRRLIACHGSCSCYNNGVRSIHIARNRSQWAVCKLWILKKTTSLWSVGLHGSGQPQHSLELYVPQVHWDHIVCRNVATSRRLQWCILYDMSFTACELIRLSNHVISSVFSHIYIYIYPYLRMSLRSPSTAARLGDDPRRGRLPQENITVADRPTNCRGTWATPRRVGGREGGTRLPGLN